MQDMEASGLNPEYTKYIADEAKEHNITIAASKPDATNTMRPTYINKKKHR